MEHPPQVTNAFEDLAIACFGEREENGGWDRIEGEREINSQPGLEGRGLEDHAVFLCVYRSFRGFPLKVIISADWKIVLKDLLLWYNFLHILLVAIQLQRIHQFLACLLLLPEPPIKKRPY